MLRDPLAMANTPGSHGIRPAAYKVEFLPDTQVTGLFAAANSWTERAVRLDKVDIGYGPGDCTATFSMWDPDSVEAPNINGNNRDQVMAKPKNGELVRVWHYDEAHPDGLLVFKGAIRQVHDAKSGDGVEWIVEAVSDAARLNQLHVTFSANINNDPINPTPRFDRNGFLVEARLKTVAELIREVMDFPDAWGRPEAFAYANIKWASTTAGKTLETEARCGAFTPTDISFSDTPKGQAIQEILDAAGNFTYLYIPDPDGNDTILIVEFNQACNRCGDQWDINFPTTDRVALLENTPYAFQNSIKGDSTIWTMRDTANVCRLSSGPIRFYSGQYPIPEYRTGVGSTDLVYNVASEYNEDVNSVIARARNNDLVNYRFTPKVGKSYDKRKKKVFYVGMPLFPDWNVHEDYLPQVIQIGDVVAPDGFAPGENEQSYRGRIEWGQRLSGDLTAAGGVYDGRVNNMRMYQAWYADAPCPGCNGVGLVEQVYSNPENEPEFRFYAVHPSGEREVSLPAVLRENEIIEPRVDNYLFDPKHFGEPDPDPSKGEPYWKKLTPLAPPSGGDDYTEYPLPWKNLCPACRGVGLRPQFKIRNIDSRLFSGRNNQAGNVTEDNPEIPLDPDATASGPESWEDATSRVVMTSPPLIQMESHYKDFLPDFDLRNQTWATMADNIKSRKESAAAGSPSPGAKKLAHPLQFKKLKKLLAQQFHLTTDDAAQLAESTWGCYVPFTTVLMRSTVPYTVDPQLGRIQFQGPVFVPCVKEFKAYKKQGTGQEAKHVVDKTGVLKSDPTVRRAATKTGAPLSYWRPARVWMTCFYTRPNFFDMLSKDRDGNPIPDQEFDFTDPDGNAHTYVSRAMVLDGRYAVEVKRKNADENNPDEFTSGTRVLQVAASDMSSVVEVGFRDFYRMPVIPKPGATPKELEAYKAQQHFDFPRMKVLKFEQTTPGELQREMAGYGSRDYFNSIYRPKVFTAGLRDNRPRILELAAKKLEYQNDVMVNGSLTLVGQVQDLSAGLGFVDYPDRAKSVVRRVTLSYQGGFTATLDLSVERARFGQMPPTEAERQNLLAKDVTALKRIIYMNRDSIEQATAADASQNGTGQHQDLNGNTHDDDSGSAGHFRMFVR